MWAPSMTDRLASDVNRRRFECYDPRKAQLAVIRYLAKPNDRYILRVRQSSSHAWAARVPAVQYNNQMNEGSGALTEWTIVATAIGTRVSAAKNPAEESLVVLQELDGLVLNVDGRNLLAGLLLRTADKDVEAKQALAAAASGKHAYFVHVAKSVLENYHRRQG